MKKITADDLILAIGNLDDKLIQYPKKRSVKVIVFKNLSIAASFMICIAISISAVLSGLFAKFDAKSDLDGNFAPENNVGTSSSQAYTLSFDESGKIKNNSQNENNSLQFNLTSGYIYVSLDQNSESSQRNKLYIKYEDESLTECEIFDITPYKTVYRIEPSLSTHLVCDAKNAFEITVTSEDGGYKLTVVYK